MAERGLPAPVSQPPALPPTATTSEEGSRAAHALVSNLVTTTIDKALPRIQESIMDVVEARMTGAFREQQEALTLLIQRATPGTTTPSEGQSSVANAISVANSCVPATTTASVTAPVVGCLPNPSLIANIPSFARAGGPSCALSSSVAATLSPSTPLMSLLPHIDSVHERTANAVLIGCSSPPIPRKLAEKAWGGEYIDLAELSPARLGAPEPTLLELFAGNGKAKSKKGAITTIEAWVVCFNAYVALIAMRHPDRVVDLLAYSSIIVKASQDYEQTPWLAYDQHFRKQAAAKQLRQWDTVDTSLWTMYFGRATPRVRCNECGLPGHMQCTPSENRQSGKPLGHEAPAKATRKFEPYPRQKPICRRWNSAAGCRQALCTYRHVCLECHAQDHKELQCPLTAKGKDKQRGTAWLRGERPGAPP